eukprot:Gb_15601 [translate_table: standard]
MKEFSGEWSGISSRKHVFLWLIAALIPLAILLRICLSSTFYIIPALPSASYTQSFSNQTAIPRETDTETFEEIVARRGERCDLFKGDWIPQPLGPYYTNESCTVIQEHQNCMKNGRPDAGYLFWRWKPDDCDLPRFNGTRFLQIVRNKVWAFIGDSIARNNVQSLLCLLAQVEDPIDTYHDEAYLFRRWYFPHHNFTLTVLWSPYLVKDIEEINGLLKDQTKVYLDTIDDKWKNQLHEFDFVVLSGGEWFYKPSIYLEENEVVGCHYCPGMNFTELEINFVYGKALRSVFKFINTSPDYKGFTFFRTFTSDHFENGQWFSGGTCQRTVPFKKDQIVMENIDAEMRKVELEEFETAAKEGFARGLKFKLLDTSQASLLRPDGHPGPYRYYYPFANDTNAKVQNDCLHWCLPGPIDTWSELLLEILQH